MKSPTKTYQLFPAKIQDIRQQTHDVKTFKVSFIDENVRDTFDYNPGQFAQLAIPGFGEGPICITSSPSRKGFLEFSIRAVGKLTTRIHECKVNDILYVRGPYGKSFPYEEAKEKDLVFVAGGMGMAPLRSIINLVMDNKSSFGKISILHGAKSPDDLVYKDELKEWACKQDVHVELTVDTPSADWNARVGLITELCCWAPGVITKDSHIGYVCGPPIMLRFVLAKLESLGFSDENLFVTLERQMQCGVGKCGHCNIGGKFICTDGPVFSYAELKKFPEKEHVL